MNTKKLSPLKRIHPCGFLGALTLQRPPPPHKKKNQRNTFAAPCSWPSFGTFVLAGNPYIVAHRLERMAGSYFSLDARMQGGMSLQPQEVILQGGRAFQALEAFAVFFQWKIKNDTRRPATWYKDP